MSRPPGSRRRSPWAARRRGRLLLAGVILGSLLLWGITLVAAIHARGYRAADDAFIAFRIAENVASGHGFCFNADGPAVEAASSFLFTLALAGAQRLGLSIIFSAVTLSLCCAAATLALLAWCMHRAAGPWSLWAPFAMASMALVCRNAASGLETTLAGLLLLASVALYIQAERTPRSDRRLLFLSSTVIALLSMARPEGPIVLVALGLIRARELRHRRQRGEALQLRTEVVWLLGFLVLFVPYTLWRASTFGSLLPAAYYAKELQFENGAQKLGVGLLYLRQIALAQPVLVFSLAAGAWAQLVAPSRRLRALLAVLGAQCAFIVLSGGDWPHMFEYSRFFYPVVPISLWILGEAAVVLVRLRRPGWLVAIAVGLAVLGQVDLVKAARIQLHPRFRLAGPSPLTRQALYLAYVDSPRRLSKSAWMARSTQTFDLKRYHDNFDAAAARWLQDRYPPNTRLAAIQAGQFAFWSRMPFFDLFGLVTPPVARLGRRHDPEQLAALIRRFNPLLIAFYKWDGGVHHRHLVLSDRLWKAGYGLRYVLGRGQDRAFVVFERGYRSLEDPRQVLFSAMADLRHQVDPTRWIPLPGSVPRRPRPAATR